MGKAAHLTLILLFALLSGSYSHVECSQTYEVSVKITNIRNSKGTMQLQVYRSQKAFAAETPYKTFRISKKNVSGKVLRYKIKGLPKDYYGVALLDDENSNKLMDYGLILPKEGFGFSDYYHKGWSKPSYYDFNFYLKENKSVSMKVRYM